MSLLATISKAGAGNMPINFAILTKSAMRVIRKYACDERGLKDMPESAMTKEICLAVVASDGLELAYVPERFRDRMVCLAAVRSDGRALAFVPWEKRDRKICLAALRNPCRDDGFPDDNLLMRVPEPLRDAEMCGEAVRHAVPDDQVLSHVPRRALSRELCLAAIRIDGQALRFVPECLRGLELCVAALQNPWPGMRDFVPEAFRNHPSITALLPGEATPRKRRDACARTPRYATFGRCISRLPFLP